MFRTDTRNHGPGSWYRRLVALVMCVVQLGIAAASPFEPNAAAYQGAHVEQDDAQHPLVHNETSCALCAVSSLQATVGLLPQLWGMASPPDAKLPLATEPPPKAARFANAPARAPPTFTAT
jgi:hypothetical protein